MTIKNYATLVLVLGIGLVSGTAIYAYGGIQQLLSAQLLLALFGINLPFFILWAVAISAKGTAVPRWAIAISIAFILLDAAVYFGTGSKSDDSDQIVFAVAASVEMIGALLMVIVGIVSRVRWEGDSSNNDG
jgi:hypothetical protein